MNKVIIGVLVMVLVSSMPAFAIETVFTSIPKEYYVPVVVGAATEAILRNSGTGKMESVYLVAGLSIAKELFDSTFLGRQFSWTNVGAATLGGGLAFYF